MANHGRTRHSKRLALSPLVPIPRKGTKYVNNPSGGRHKKVSSMTILLLLRDVLKIAKDAREASMLLSSSKVLVDGRPVKDPALLVGLMDIISIPSLKVAYRLIIMNGHFVPVSISIDTSSKLCKIIGKKIIKSGKIQLALHDGRSYIIEKEEDRFSVGDTIKIKFPTQTLEGFMKLEKGAKCYVFSGKHAGKIGVLDSILERAGSAPADVLLKVDNQKIITRKDYVLAVEESFNLPKK